MRILHLCSHLNSGGITSYLLGLIPEQKALGNQVYVWGADGNRKTSFEECSDDVMTRIKRTKSELSPTLWIKLPGLISYLKKNQIDVMHAHTRVMQVLCGAASKLTGIPFVSTGHGFYKPRLGRKLFPCWGEEVCAISQSVKDGLVTDFSGIHLPPVRVVHNGVDVDSLRRQMDGIDREGVRTDLGYEMSDKVVISVSRLRSSKGIHHLVAGFAAARERNTNLKLLILGGGDDEYLSELKKQADELGVTEHVKFAGNQENLAKYFKVADMFVAPNLPPEGFGLSILEAMTAGLPIAASNTGGITELLEKGRVGLLFEPGNEGEIRDALISISSNEKHAEEMAAVANETADRYSTRAQAEKIQSCYEDILNG